MTDRVAYRQGIALQPDSMRAVLAALPGQLERAELGPLASGTIALTGIGASLYAAMAGAAHMRRLGLRAHALPATDLYDAAVDAADAYVALSASGRSVEPAHAMELRQGAPTYGLAKQSGTPLQRTVHTLFATGSGADSSPNTTSFTGSLLALGLLADRIAPGPSGAPWARLPDALTELLEGLRPHVARGAALLARRTAIDCVAAGAAFGVAGYAALLLREAVRVPAQHWDTLNFLHGPMEPNDARTGVIVYGSGRERQLARDLALFGIPTVLITEEATAAGAANLVAIPVPSVAPGLPDAILQALPAQMLVADMMEQAGLPECRFRYRQTDTKLAA